MHYVYAVLINTICRIFLDLRYKVLICHFSCNFGGKSLIKSSVWEHTPNYSILNILFGSSILFFLYCSVCCLTTPECLKDCMKHFTYTVFHQPKRCTQPLDSIYYSLNWSYWVSPAAPKWVRPQRDGWEWRPAALELPFCCCVIYYFQFTQSIIENCISQSAALWALISMNHYFLLWKQGRCTCHDPTWLQSVHNKLGSGG